MYHSNFVMIVWFCMLLWFKGFSKLQVINRLITSLIGNKQKLFAAAKVKYTLSWRRKERGESESLGNWGNNSGCVGGTTYASYHTLIEYVSFSVFRHIIKTELKPFKIETFLVWRGYQICTGLYLYSFSWY